MEEIDIEWDPDGAWETVKKNKKPRDKKKPEQQAVVAPSKKLGTPRNTKQSAPATTRKGNSRGNQTQAGRKVIPNNDVSNWRTGKRNTNATTQQQGAAKTAQTGKKMSTLQQSSSVLGKGGPACGKGPMGSNICGNAKNIKAAKNTAGYPQNNIIKPLMADSVTECHYFLSNAGEVQVLGDTENGQLVQQGYGLVPSCSDLDGRDLSADVLRAVALNARFIAEQSSGIWNGSPVEGAGYHHVHPGDIYACVADAIVNEGLMTNTSGCQKNTTLNSPDKPAHKMSSTDGLFQQGYQHSSIGNQEMQEVQSMCVQAIAPSVEGGNVSCPPDEAADIICRPHSDEQTVGKCMNENGLDPCHAREDSHSKISPRKTIDNGQRTRQTTSEKKRKNQERCKANGHHAEDHLTSTAIKNTGSTPNQTNKKKKKKTHNKRENVRNESVPVQLDVHSDTSLGKKRSRENCHGFVMSKEQPTIGNRTSFDVENNGEDNPNGQQNHEENLVADPTPAEQPGMEHTVPTWTHIPAIIVSENTNNNCQKTALDDHETCGKEKRQKSKPKNVAQIETRAGDDRVLNHELTGDKCPDDTNVVSAVKVCKDNHFLEEPVKDISESADAPLKCEGYAGSNEVGESHGGTPLCSKNEPLAHKHKDEQTVLPDKKTGTAESRSVCEKDGGGEHFQADQDNPKSSDAEHDNCLDKQQMEKAVDDEENKKHEKKGRQEKRKKVTYGEVIDYVMTELQKIYAGNGDDSFYPVTKVKDEPLPDELVSYVNDIRNLSYNYESYSRRYTEVQENKSCNSNEGDSDDLESTGPGEEGSSIIDDHKDCDEGLLLQQYREKLSLFAKLSHLLEISSNPEFLPTLDTWIADLKSIPAFSWNDILPSPLILDDHRGPKPSELEAHGRNCGQNVKIMGDSRKDQRGRDSDLDDINSLNLMLQGMSLDSCDGDEHLPTDLKDKSACIVTSEELLTDLSSPQADSRSTLSPHRASIAFQEDSVEGELLADTAGIDDLRRSLLSRLAGTRAELEWYLTSFNQMSNERSTIKGPSNIWQGGDVKRSFTENTGGGNIVAENKAEVYLDDDDMLEKGWLDRNFVDRLTNFEECVPREEKATLREKPRKFKGLGFWWMP